MTDAPANLVRRDELLRHLVGHEDYVFDVAFSTVIPTRM